MDVVLVVVAVLAAYVAVGRAARTSRPSLKRWGQEVHDTALGRGLVGSVVLATSPLQPARLIVAVAQGLGLPTERPDAPGPEVYVDGLGPDGLRFVCTGEGSTIFAAVLKVHAVDGGSVASFHFLEWEAGGAATVVGEMARLRESVREVLQRHAGGSEVTVRQLT